MLWIHAINESAAPEFAEGVMNPMSPDKIRTLGRRLRLTSEHHVLDAGAGRCGPALILAREFGCRVTAVEPYEPFLEDARRRVDEVGLSDRFRFVDSDAEDFDMEPESYDVCMCLGATWAWGSLDGTLDALAKGTRAGGHVVVGEVYTVEPRRDQEEGPTLTEIIEGFESRELRVVTLIRSTADDWDTYNSIQTISLLEWMDANPEHPEIETVRKWRAEAAVRLTEPHIGWVIVTGRKGTESGGLR